MEDSEPNFDTKITEALNQLSLAIVEAIKLEVAKQVQLIETAPAFTAPPEDAESTLLSKKDAAKFLQVSVRTVEQWMNRGYLPYYRIGRVVRFRKRDILDYLEHGHLLKGRRSW